MKLATLTSSLKAMPPCGTFGYLPLIASIHIKAGSEQNFYKLLGVRTEIEIKKKFWKPKGQLIKHMVGGGVTIEYISASELAMRHTPAYAHRRY